MLVNHCRFLGSKRDESIVVIVRILKLDEQNEFYRVVECFVPLEFHLIVKQYWQIEIIDCFELDYRYHLVVPNRNDDLLFN